MHARTIEPAFEEPAFQLTDLTVAQATDAFANIPQPAINDHLGAIRGLFYAVVFQGILGLILFAGWGLWRVLR